MAKRFIQQEEEPQVILSYKRYNKTFWTSNETIAFNRTTDEKSIKSYLVEDLKKNTQ